MQVFSVLSLATLLILTGCSNHPPLSGTIRMDPEGPWKHKVYLIDPLTFDGIAMSYAGQVLDSAEIAADGSFAFATMPDSPEPRLLEIAIQKQSERYANALEHADPATDNYIPLIWQSGEVIDLTSDTRQFAGQVSMTDASPENAAILQLRDLRIKAFESHLAGQAEATHDADLLALADRLSAYQQPLMAFARETPYLLPALVAIRWSSPAGDYERIPEFIFSQCEKWQTQNSGHPYVAEFCRHADRKSLPVLVGDQIPDFPLPMLSGDTIPLHQLMGPKLTILDLWASWCAPCRKENREFLVPLWQTYHLQGLTIIGYALDASARAWNGAIEKDGTSGFHQASHLQGDDAPLFDVLHIQTIPANFLIDSSGQVVAKNLHGEALVEFIESYLKQ